MTRDSVVCVVSRLAKPLELIKVALRSELGRALGFHGGDGEPRKQAAAEITIVVPAAGGWQCRRDSRKGRDRATWRRRRRREQRGSLAVALSKHEGDLCAAVATTTDC